MLRKLANGWHSGSLAARLRQKRFAYFLSLLEQLPAAVDILDIGGQENYWKIVGTDHPKIRSITLLNLWKEPAGLPKLNSVSGDARDLSEYGEQSVDVIFSNSVIEHVGGLREQQRMAREVQRIGKRYIIQTPNRFFPLEPHFLVPFFQFFPTRFRALLHHQFTLGWWRRQPDYLEALAEVESIRLLDRTELTYLFPGSTLITEKLAGLTKSLIVTKGWSAPPVQSTTASQTILQP
jgi:hypothetical protein